MFSAPRLWIHLLSLVWSRIEIWVSNEVSGQSERATNRKNYAQVARVKSNVYENSKRRNHRFRRKQQRVFGAGRPTQSIDDLIDSMPIRNFHTRVTQDPPHFVARNASFSFRRHSSPFPANHNFWSCLEQSLHHRCGEEGEEKNRERYPCEFIAADILHCLHEIGERVHRTKRLSGDRPLIVL